MTDTEFKMWGEVFNFRKKYLTVDNTDYNRQQMLKEGESILKKQPPSIYKFCLDLIWAVTGDFERKAGIGD